LPSISTRKLNFEKSYTMLGASSAVLGHLQRADLFSCLNLSNSVRLGRPTDTKISDVRLRAGVFPAGIPTPKKIFPNVSWPDFLSPSRRCDSIGVPPELGRAAPDLGRAGLELYGRRRSSGRRPQSSGGGGIWRASSSGGPGGGAPAGRSAAGGAAPAAGDGIWYTTTGGGRRSSGGAGRRKHADGRRRRKHADGELARGAPVRCSGSAGEMLGERERRRRERGG
jgi:hypothetical protein